MQNETHFHSPALNIPSCCSRGNFILLNLMTYAEKLKDPRWQKKRLEILQRDNWTCQECNDTENTLHVHHKVYDAGKDPWEYENKLLITLCRDCHEREGEMLKEYSALLIDTLRRSPFMADDLRELAWGFSKMVEFSEKGYVMARLISKSLQDEDAIKALIKIDKQKTKQAKIHNEF